MNRCWEVEVNADRRPANWVSRINSSGNDVLRTTSNVAVGPPNSIEVGETGGRGTVTSATETIETGSSSMAAEDDEQSNFEIGLAGLDVGG